MGWADLNKASYIGRNVPKELFLARGMLSPGEIRALFTCAADFFKGNGLIVDAGAFAGLSAHSFATGLRHNNGYASDGDPVIHSYDKFRADEPSVLKFLKNVFYSSRTAEADIKDVLWEPDKGEDFLHVFWHQNQMYSDLIEAHQGDFSTKNWTHGGIEILFVDICKTKLLQDHMLKEFMPNMIAGESILIQQDYNHVWHPYIHLAMEVLSPCFEVLVDAQEGSRIYFCKEQPSDDLLKEAIALDFDAAQINGVFEAIIEKSIGLSRLLMQVAHVKALKDAGFEDEAIKISYPLRVYLGSERKGAWALSQLERMLSQ